MNGRLGVKVGLCALACLVAYGWRSPIAQACDCGGRPGYFLFGDHGVVPQNTRAVPYVFRSAQPYSRDDKCTGDVRRYAPKQDAFRVERLDGRKAVAVPHRVETHVERRMNMLGPGNSPCAGLMLVVPEELQAGKRYRFHGPNKEATIAITVSEEQLASAPARLELSKQERGSVEIAMGGSCYHELEDTIQMQLEIQLPEAAREFIDTLLFTTLVGDQVWRPAKNLCDPVDVGSSWKGLGKELLFTTCDKRPWGLGKGSHPVKMRAVLPGTEVAFETKVEPIELRCPPKAEPPPSKPQPSCGSCRANGKPPGSSGSWFAIAPLILWAARRRRASGRRRACG